MAGQEPGEQAGHVWCGKAAAGNLLGLALSPSHLEVLSLGQEFDQGSGSVVEGVGRGRPGEPDGDDGGEVTGPFAPGEIDVVTGGHDVALSEVGLIDPILVGQDMVFAGAAEAAMEDVVAAVEGLANALADDGRARSQVGAEDAEAAQLGLGGHRPENPGNGGAVTVNIGAAARLDAQLEAIIIDHAIVGQRERLEGGVGGLDAGVEDGDADALPGGGAEKGGGILE